MHEGVWLGKNIFKPTTNFVVGILFSSPSVRASVRSCVRPYITFCFLNILKSHFWIFIKPCKHVHICKTNTLDKKVRARANSIRFISLCKWLVNIGAYAIIGHTGADQLLPQLLMEQFDTFPIQCRHIEHLHEGVWYRKSNF